MITYTIKEENEDIKKAVIVKTGHEVELTLENIESNKTYLEKAQKEIVAQKNHNDLVLKNIEEHHPFVKDLSEEQLHTISLYAENKKIVNQCNAKLEEITKALSEGEIEVEEIKKQINYVEEIINETSNE